MTFGDTPILRKRGSSRMLRRVASERGVPSVSLEFGEATTVQPVYVDSALATLRIALAGLRVIPAGDAPVAALPRVYEKPFWVRAERGGIFLTRSQLGDEIAEGEVIGVIANPLTEEETPIRTPRAGRILGLASGQFVLPGYGVYHVGRPAD
jgi:predicted deacylase